MLNKEQYDELKKKAKSGDHKAQYDLGQYHFEQFLKYMRAAAKGNEEAKVQLAKWLSDASKEPEQSKKKTKGAKPVSNQPVTKNATKDSEYQPLLEVRGTVSDEKEKVHVLAYEHIVEQVKKLSPQVQYDLARLCVECAAPKHQDAASLLARWDAESVIQEIRVECRKPHAVFYGQSLDVAWDADVEAAPEVGNSEVELMDWGTLVCGQEATEVCLPDDTKETEESTLEYEALAQEVLPPDENLIAESGHSPAEETEVHHVAPPPPEPTAAEAAPASCGWWSMILNFFTGKRRCKGK